MWKLVYLILLALPFISECQTTSPTEDEFINMLDDAVAEVYSHHAEEMSKSSSPPYFNMPDNFMRSFLPDTGVGNREELIIKETHPLQVYDEFDFELSSFHYKHFNNSDYIMGNSNNDVVLIKVDASEKYVMLSRDNLTFHFRAGTDTVKDATLFTRFTKHTEVLYMAILVENPKTSIAYVYEIVGDGGLMVALIDLKMNPETSPNRAKKIAYVQSSHGGSLVILVETEQEVNIVHKQQGRSEHELNRYIEVNYPYAVDLVTFTVHGHGYIVVANPVVCDIYKMDEFIRSHVFFDRLGPLSNIRDLEYFRLGFHHYLAVADSQGQILYTWKSGEFAEKQKLDVPNVVQIYAATVESCRDEVVLLMISEDGSTNLHVFSGEHEDFRKVDSVIPSVHLIKPNSMASFTFQNKVVILYLSVHAEPEALIIETSLKPVRDSLLVEGEKVSKLMKDVQDMLAGQKREIERLKEILKDAVRSSGTQHIMSLQIFKDLVSDETVVQELGEFQLEWDDSSLTLEEYRRGADDLEKNVERLENVVAEIEMAMPDVVRLDQEAVITGRKIFSGNVFVEQLWTTSLNLGTVDGLDLPQIQKDVYRLDKPQIIEGTLTFQEPLVITGNLEVDTTVNGIDISEEVMTTHTQQISNAQMHFLNKLVVGGNLEISGKVNNIDISEEVVTLNGTHHITGHKSFSNGIQAQNVKTKLLDGVDIDELYKRAFTISGKQTITADMTFMGATTNGIILKGRLNGYDVTELEKNIVRIDKPTTVSGYKIFENDMTIDGGLTVKGTVNGLRIPDDLFLTDEHQVITGTKEFLGPVSVLKVIVSGKVDGLKLPDDIVTLSKDEEISSTLYFVDGIIAKQNIIVKYLVDDVDISEMAKQALKLNESNQFSDVVFLGPVNVMGDLTVKGLINNVDLNNLVKDIVFKDENPIIINSKKIFEKVTADEVKLDRFFNGYNIDIDLIKVKGDQVINGTQTFKQAVTFNSIYTVDGLIGGLNITDLYLRLMALVVKEDNEVEFADHVVVKGNVNIHGTINGLRIPHDVVLRNSNKEISNKQFAGKVVVDNLIIDGNAFVEKFGGVDLSRFFTDRVTLSTDQEIPGDIWLGNSTADKVHISGLVNGMDISDFAKNVMSKTKPQTVTAIKEFSGEVFVHGPITTNEGVNGIDLSDIKTKAFKLLEDNIVTAPVEFEDNVTFNNLVVTGLINGVNITRLKEDSLKKTGIQTVTGDTIFNSGFHVIGDILATKVNDLVLSEDILLKSPPQTITGRFTIGSVGIGGDLAVNGTINSLDLSELTQKLARIDSEPVIESSITFTSPVYVYEDIEVTGMVNEIHLKKIAENVLTKTGNQTITGSKIFRGNITIEGDVNPEFVNGINWKEFLDDVVWINIPQVIKSRKTFVNDISAEKGVFVSGNARVRLVNGKDLKEFFDEAVYLDVPTNITGPVTFKSPVVISGDMKATLINGLRLQKDVITIACTDDGPQIITGQKTFENVKVLSDIYADTVNTYDLQELYEDTLLIDGNQTVTGQKIIRGDVTFKKDVHPDLVNGMILNKDLVTLDTPQKIEGPVTFKGDIFVEKDMLIDGLVNGVDLQKLSEEAVYLKTNQVIEGSYSFQNAVVSSNVEVNGTVNGIDLETFDRNVTQFLKDTAESLVIMDKYAQDHCDLAKYLQESLENSYYALDSLSIHQELDSPASFLHIISEGKVALVSLDDTIKKANSVTYVWDDASKKLNSLNSAESLVAKSTSYKVGNISLTVNIGIHSKDSSLIIHGVPSNVQNGFIDASVVLRKEGAVIALLYPAKEICRTYLVNEYSTDKLETTLVVGKEATSIVMFELSHILYLAVSSSYSPPYVRGSLKIFSRTNGEWHMVQSIGTSSSSFVKHFEYHGYHYVAFPNDAPVYETKEPKSIQIYRNSGPNELMFSLFQKVPFDDSRGVEIFNFGDLSQLHLIAWNATKIQIFGLEGESGMRSLFTLHGKCVKDVKPFLIGDDFYLIVGQQNLMTSDAVQSVLYKGLTKGIKYKPYNLAYC